MTGKGEEVVRRLARAGHDLAGYEWLFDQGSLTGGPPAMVPTPSAGSRRQGLHLPLAGWVTDRLTIEQKADVVDVDVMGGFRQIRPLSSPKEVRIKASLPSHLFEGSPPILDPNSTDVHDLIIITPENARIDAKAFIATWAVDFNNDTYEVEFLVSGEPTITPAPVMT